MQPVRGHSPPLSIAALGTLDFSLLYDQENNALHCTISKAKVGPRHPLCPGPGPAGGAVPRPAPAISCTGLVVPCCAGAGWGENSCLNHLSGPKKPCIARCSGEGVEQRTGKRMRG